MVEMKKPVASCDYNEYSSGVDHVDQMILYYPCTRKTLKWTKKVFFLPNGALCNKSYSAVQNKGWKSKNDFPQFSIGTYFTIMPNIQRY